MNQMKLLFMTILALMFLAHPLFAEPIQQIEIVFDASRSMNDLLGQETKLETAKKTLVTTADQIAPGSKVGLRVFGAAPVQGNVRESCFDSQLVMPIVSFSKSAMISRVMSLQAFGQTALGYSLEMAAKDFDASPEVQKSIILISDGEESCGKDPVAVIKNLKAQGIDIKVHAIGFGVDDKTKSQLQQIAQLTGGSYQDAKDAGELKKSIVQAAQKENIIAPSAVKKDAATPEKPEENPQMLLQVERGKGENVLAAAAGARIVSASNQEVALVIDGSEDTFASLGDGDYAVISFKENQPVLLESFSVPIFEESSSNPKIMQLSGSMDNPQTGFVPLLSISVSNKVDFKNVYQEFKINPPAAIKYLKVKIGPGQSGGYSYHYEWRASGKIMTEQELQASRSSVKEQERNLIAKDAGGSIAAASKEGFEALIDGVSGQEAGHDYASLDSGDEVVFSFDGGREAYLTKVVVPIFGASDENCKTIAISVSEESPAAGFHDAGSFQTTNMLINGQPNQEFKFPAPVKAKFAKMRMVDDHAGNGSCYLGELEIFGTFTAPAGAGAAASLPVPAVADQTQPAAAPELAKTPLEDEVSNPDENKQAEEADAQSQPDEDFEK